MRYFRYAGAALTAILAAGCGDSADDDRTDTADNSQTYESPTATGETMETGPAETATPPRAQETGARSAAPGIVTISVAESEEFGRYLTDGQGRALYMFTADTKGAAGSDPVISCAGQCLEIWPLAMTSGNPGVGGGADPALIGRFDYEGDSIVTYDGWPLYYFSSDTAAGTPKGQEINSFGGEWYLVTPDGMKAGDAEMEDTTAD